MKLAGVFALLGLVTVANGAIFGAVKGGRTSERPVHFLRAGEELTLSWKLNGREHSVSWFQIEPELRAYDNRPGENVPLPLIHYRHTAASRSAQSRLTLRFPTPGTRYFYAGTTMPSHFTDSAPLHRKYAGRIVQVVVRAGDSYVDFLGELMGTPFVLGPGVVAAGWHQTDQRVGSDCAAFATYGRRRMGNPTTYAGPVGIVRDLRPLTRTALIASSKDGVYRDGAGRRFPVGKRGLQPGDLVHFGPQVSVFYADRGTPGVLDANDLLFQSWRTTPHITTLRESGFFDRPVRVYRWR